MKITKQNVIDLQKGLNAVSKLSGSVKFAYAVSRNTAKLKPELESIASTQEKSFAEYEKERKALAELHAEQVDGKPKIENDSYVLKDRVKFDEEFKKLQEKYKPVDDEFAEFLKEEVDIDLYTIPPTYLPDAITADQISGIILMIEENITN